MRLFLFSNYRKHICVAIVVWYNVDECYPFLYSRYNMDTTQANEYINSINRVFDHIEQNLCTAMTLEELSTIAGFSQYHFHRIFSAMTGETLFSFIWRLRLERAAALLCSSGKPVTQIAHSLCFSSSAVFSRMFKKQFGMSPSEFRKSNQSQNDSSLSQLLRNCSNAAYLYSLYDTDSDHKEIFRRFEMETKVVIEKMEDTRVAYLRYVGPYAGDEKLFESLYAKLGAWAGPRGIDMATSYIIYHDDPNITDEQKLRLSVCVPIPDSAEVSGEFGEMTIKGGSYAVGTFNLTSQEYGEAWGYMCGQWLPQSGYKPADSVPFERYTNGGDDVSCSGKMKVDICIPVEID